MNSQRNGFATYLAAGTPGATTDLTTPATVLAIGAHPDDIEFGCGATLAKWAEHSSEIYVAILTDGRRGTWNREQDQLALALSRQNEARSAALELGAHAPVFFQQIDGELHPSSGVILRLVTLLRSIRPSVVLTHDPWKRYRLHPDHRITGEIVVEALVQARDESFWQELVLPASRPDSLLLFEADVEDHSETVDRRHLEAKARALACHRSQYPSSYGLAAETQDATDQLLPRLIEVASQSEGDLLVERFKLIADL
ncbi:PIG-L deacetylase family protein [Ferrimicrobium sp.]|uniref:PIG-L deacetylase family protein n=1 Tax=Ferrimicrobium sp. TaxID=2926050 RepID=UPI00261B3C7D|nr:PIG-L deacetylase family protein [Ferrimicrobium sp.]